MILINLNFFIKKISKYISKNLTKLFIYYSINTLKNNNYPELRTVIIIANQISKNEENSIIKRVQFYQLKERNLKLLLFESLPKKFIFSLSPVLLFNEKNKFKNFLLSLRPAVFNINYNSNPNDGWEWIEFSNFLLRKKINLEYSNKLLTKRIRHLLLENKSKCYIFGTGPSLEKAITKNWGDGYCIVCNTIVKDKKLYDHIQPDFIVAGDAIFHFGFSNYAKKFREDLHERLISSDTLFIYPLQFDCIIRNEFTDISNKLVPIPVGRKKIININLVENFKLPNLGNVLGLLLLPLGCTLSKNIYLWGFDGRAPDDQFFWKNSNNHSYPEYYNELVQSHPAFFEYYVPKTDPGKYIREVQGDKLDLVLQKAEKKGWNFYMLHKSWTQILQKRYYKDSNDI